MRDAMADGIRRQSKGAITTGTQAMLLFLALLIGIVAGLRAMTAPAAVSWAGYAGWLPLAGTPLAFMGWWWVPWLLTLLALGELVTDQLPSTPSRKVPIQFGSRVVTGGLSGATVAATGVSLAAGAVAGAVGAVVGTLGGAILRARAAAFFGGDRPAAFMEDAIAIIAALLIVSVA
jgi:uncharacterized membrane protein